MIRKIYRSTLIILIALNSFLLKAETEKRFLFVISAHEYGYFLPELVTPLRILNLANIKVDIASPAGGKGHAVAKNRLSRKDKQYFKSIGSKLPNPIPLKEIDANLYAGIYVVGGSGPMLDLYDNKQVSRLVKEFNLQNKIISADCHGPVAIAGVKLTSGEYLVKGRKITAKSNAEEGSWSRSRYPFLVEDKLIEHGAIYSAAGPGNAYFVVDGNLVTGQNPASAQPLANKLVELIQKSSHQK